MASFARYRAQQRLDRLVNPRAKFADALAGTDDVEFIRVFVRGEEQEASYTAIPTSVRSYISIVAYSENHRFSWRSPHGVPEVLVDDWDGLHVEPQYINKDW